ncbi:MAG TPA: SdrD B-like domain-containing protein, partial [bacterium]|nr:SdrD B-like domain-containing protein [bacterium]
HQSTTTTASGAYTFTRLVPDTYYLIFSLPPEYTFSPASAGIDRGLDSDVNSSGHTASFTLASGEVRTDLDAGIFIPDPCGDGTCAADEDYASCPQDCEKPAPEPVCGDRTCDSGETYTSCPLDCPRPVVCGDGVCEGSETYAACPIDCPRPIVCGDGVCEGSETYATCSADCPRPIVCGDGVCEGSENFDSCPADCPKPEVLGVTDTPVDPPPFFVSGPAAVMLSETNVKFSWVASEPVRAVVRYGRIGQDPGEAPTDESRDSDELTVTDLQPDTEYLFVVMITDAGGQSLTSEPGRFRTPRAEQAKPAAHSTPAPVEELPPADATGEQLHELQQEFHQETAAAVRGGVIIGAGLAYLAQASGAGLGFFGQALSAFLKALRNLRIPGLTELYELLENREERKKTKKELEEIAEEQEDT